MVNIINQRADTFLKFIISKEQQPNNNILLKPLKSHILTPQGNIYPITIPTIIIYPPYQRLPKVQLKMILYLN